MNIQFKAVAKRKPDVSLDKRTNHITLSESALSKSGTRVLDDAGSLKFDEKLKNEIWDERAWAEPRFGVAVRSLSDQSVIGRAHQGERYRYVL